MTADSLTGLRCCATSGHHLSHSGRKSFKQLPIRLAHADPIFWVPLDGDCKSRAGLSIPSMTPSPAIADTISSSPKRSTA